MESQTTISGRPGFEYRYRIRMADEIISVYDEEIRCSCACYGRCFLVEVRTNFSLKPSLSVEEIMDSERFASIIPVYADEERLSLKTRYRLFEYWLPEKEIRRLVRQAFCFAKVMELDPRHASRPVIPIAVEIDVCTVQLDGEALHATVDRSIKSDCLIPFPVWGMSIVISDESRQNMVQSEETRAMDVLLRMYLLELPRSRVRDVDKGLAARMKACPICLKAPTSMVDEQQIMPGLSL